MHVEWLLHLTHSRYESSMLQSSVVLHGCQYLPIITCGKQVWAESRWDGCCPGVSAACLGNLIKSVNKYHQLCQVSTTLSRPFNKLCSMVSMTTPRKAARNKCKMWSIQLYKGKIQKDTAWNHFSNCQYIYKRLLCIKAIPVWSRPWYQVPSFLFCKTHGSSCLNV